MPLTDAKIRNTKPSAKPIRLTDGRGLYLEVRPTGAKLWRYRYRIASKENAFAIGEYFNDKRVGHVSLEGARRSRDEAKLLVRQGIHPAHHRKAHRSAAGSTFEAVARDWLAQKQASWTPQYARKVEHFLQADIIPQLGKLPIRDVTSAHLLAILRQVEKRGAKTIALLLRQWCSAIFRYAVCTLRAEGDPAAILTGAIIRPRTKHHTSLSRDQIALLITRIKSYGGQATTKIALQLALLTFVRPTELQEAEWSEVDLERAEWRIPANRMKMGEAHLVPLSKQALELLRDLHALTGNQRRLFPNRRRPKTACMTATTLNRALERMGLNGKGSIGFSAHGFRATASTFLNEAGFRPDAIERQLAHKERNTTRASYNQAEYLNERSALMQHWADRVGEIGRAAKSAAPAPNHSLETH
ncbi:MAG: tyrosine-type recombinase/integrase [Hyphomicrobium sp.]